MIKKPTDELMRELLSANNIGTYLKENEAHFIDLSITEFLNEYLKAKNLTKSTVIKKSEINEIYGYQIFAGSRIPSRDKLLSLCIAMEMSLEEAQSVLKIGGFAPLYPKSKRDSIIIHGISSSLGILDINDLLYSAEEETL